MDDGARELDRDIELAAAEHQRFLEALDARLESGSLDIAAPTRLPGWTVGHRMPHPPNRAGVSSRSPSASPSGPAGSGDPGSAGAGGPVERR